MKCDRCDTELEIGMYPFCKGDPANHGTVYGKTAGFPFEVNHVDGRPMVIESMQHLRRVERDFGVVFSAFSHASTNNVDPVDRNLPRFRGQDEDIRRDYRKRYER